MNLDDLLEKSIYRIALRLSTVEEEFFSLAGETLKKIYGMSNEQIRGYLYSDDYLEDVSGDIGKVKRILNNAHNANLQDLNTLFNDVTATVYQEGEGLAKEKGEQLLPFKEFKRSFNPMLKGVVSNYSAMAKSTTVNQTYRKTIGNFVNRLTGDEEHINYPQAMRKAIRELTDQGITTIDYESGRSVRMDSAVRRDLMTEYTEIVEGVQHKLAEEIGADGWEISAHEHAAIDHIDIQGHIFANEEFEKLQNHEDAVDIEGEKFQIDRAIGDWNCRHISFPFLIGISEPSFSKEELEAIKERNEDGITFHGKHYTLYEAEQLQRRYETEMRKEREQGNLYKQVKEGDPALEHDYRKSKERLSNLREGYKELGAALAPHAMRMKMERSYVPKGIAQREVLRIMNAITPEQVSKLNDAGILVTSEKELKQGFVDFKKHIENMEDDYKNIYSRYAETTKIQNDPLFAGGIGYDPDKDAMIYNKRGLNISKYQQPANIIFSHELAHRYDILEIKSWENKEFVGAIEAAINKVQGNIDKYNDLYRSLKNVNPAVQDILSALSDNKVKVQYKHESWTDMKMKSLEIFANMSYIQANHIKIPEFDGLLDDIMKIADTMFVKGAK